MPCMIFVLIFYWCTRTEEIWDSESLKYTCGCPGITIAKRIDKMGMRGSDTAQIFFEDVRVPAANIIGEEGKGFTYQMEQVRV